MVRAAHRRVSLHMTTLFTYGKAHREFHERLGQILEAASPHLKIRIEPLPPELCRILDEWKGDTDLAVTVAEAAGDTSGIRLLCSVAIASKFARWSVAVLPDAEWGCTHAGFLAIEYAPETNALVTQLHETLHCLGVDECYDEATRQPKANCADEECLMRYGSSGLAVCESVLLQLKEYAS